MSDCVECACSSLQELSEHSLFCVECGGITCNECLVINEDNDAECSTCYEQRAGARGFAALTSKQRADVSARGGKRAHETGKAHRFSTEEAQAAGRAGGAKIAARGKEYMAELGRRSAKKRRKR